MSDNKDKIKEDKIKEYTKKYYHSNKDKIKEDKKQKTTCECGCIISNNHIARHRKTKKHLDMVSEDNLLHNGGIIIVS